MESIITYIIIGIVGFVASNFVSDNSSPHAIQHLHVQLRKGTYSKVAWR